MMLRLCLNGDKIDVMSQLSTHLARVFASMARFSRSRSVAVSPSSIFFQAASAGSAAGGVSATQLGMMRVSCFVAFGE